MVPTGQVIWCEAMIITDEDMQAAYRRYPLVQCFMETCVAVGVKVGIA